MESSDSGPAAPTGRRWLEATVPAAILLVRLATQRTPWYVDWMIVLSLLWMSQLFLQEKRARTLAAIVAMLVLLGIYLARVLPIVADTILFCL